VKIYDSQTHKLDEYKFSYNDKETEALHKLLNKDDSISVDKLRRASLWKLNRVLDIPETTINKLQKLVDKKELSIHDEAIEEIIDELLTCSGVGMPMASTFLKFLRPDVFPIIDVRAYRAIFGKKINYSSYTYKVYREYVEKIYEIQERTNLDLAAIDEQLYSFDKEHNGKI
jgi:hypothetical protein